jgi:hypothetical protein
MITRLRCHQVLLQPRLLLRQRGRRPYLFFNNEEAAFIEAAAERLIPKDDQWAAY